jgi:anti-anti-sigma factor
MHVSARQIDSILVLTLDGELVSAIAPAFLRMARRLAAGGTRPLIAVDMTRVPRVDASGFGALVSLLRHVERRRGGLCLTGIQPDVRLLLEIMQLHLLFEVSSDLEEATDVLLAGHGVPALGDGRRLHASRAGRLPQAG